MVDAGLLPPSYQQGGLYSSAAPLEMAGAPTDGSTPRRRPRNPAPSQASRPNPRAGKTSDSGRRPRSDGDETSGAARVNPDPEQANGKSDGLGKGGSREGTDRPPHADRTIRACAMCGITAKAKDCKLPDCSGCRAGTCGVVTVTSCKLQDCSGCRSVQYCGTACQKADWPRHKPECKRLGAARAEM